MNDSHEDAHSQELFRLGLQDWVGQPERTFDQWLACHGFRLSTATVYAAMWRKWLRWTGEHRLELTRWQAHHIGEFLDSSGLEKRHRYRYTRLIERVFHHLQHLQQAVSHNPASRAVKERLAEGENDPMAFLSIEERERIIAHLQHAIHSAPTTRPTEWKAARDAALVAVFLGAGLKVAEARAATTDWLDLDGERLAVPQHTASRSPEQSSHGHQHKRSGARQVVILPFAAAVLRQWLAVRSTSGTVGTWLFPANTTGRAMHAASVYRRIELCLDHAGVLSARRERASPQTLRNSHAALLIEQNVSPEDIAHQLGMRDATSGWRVVQAYRDWQSRLAGRLPDRPVDI